MSEVLPNPLDAHASSVSVPLDSNIPTVRIDTQKSLIQVLSGDLSHPDESHPKVVSVLAALSNFPELQHLKTVRIDHFGQDIWSMATLECDADYDFFVRAKCMLENKNIEGVTDIVSFRESDRSREVLFRLEVPYFQILLRITRKNPIFT